MVDKKLNKEASHVLHQALKVLEFTMELAVQKEDIDAMIGISDRLMMLYQHLSEGSGKKFKPGFALVEKEVDDEPDQR
jgi:hypothetical protein